MYNIYTIIIYTQITHHSLCINSHQILTNFPFTKKQSRHSMFFRSINENLQTNHAHDVWMNKRMSRWGDERGEEMRGLRGKERN